MHAYWCSKDAANHSRIIIDFKQRLPRNGTQMNDQDFSVSSEFFWVTGRARVVNSQVTTQALLQRSGGWPVVVWQNVQ